MQWKRSGSIPAAQRRGKSTQTTMECLGELGGLRIGEIVHIPIVENTIEHERKATLKKYYASTKSAANSLQRQFGKKFSIYTRSGDVYVQRTI